MALKKDMQEDFLLAFIEILAKNMVDSGMIKIEGNYPDIEKIKKNIKIYEKPESTLANAIIMNQTSEIQKLMMQPFESVREISSKANIASIMEKNIDEENENILPLPMPISQKKKPVQIKKKLPLSMPVSQPMPFMHRGANMRLLHALTKPAIVPMKGMPVQPSPAAPEKPTVLGVSRIDEILKDSGVQTVECPGPNKPILVYKGGAMQASKLTLTGDEIKNIMKDISEKTRIPLMSGVFKAAFGNLIITAVMSDFVGTRFMIQKKPQLPSVQPGSIYQKQF